VEKKKGKYSGALGKKKPEKYSKNIISDREE
jgi:hypothetical protein